MQQNINNKINDKYIGIIEDIDDPLKEGRVKVRIPYLHKEIPVEHLPWAKPKNTTYFGKDGLGANISIPRKNALVEVHFNDGDRYAPEYTVIQELSDDLKDFLKNDGYENSQIFLYDGQENLKLYYIPKIGYVINLKDSTFTIYNDHRIEIKHYDDDSIIELDGSVIRKVAKSSINSTAGSRIQNNAPEIWDNGDLIKLGTDPQYSGVLGEPLFLLLDLLASLIDQKMPGSPSVATSAVSKFKALTLSKVVKTT